MKTHNLDKYTLLIETDCLGELESFSFQIYNDKVERSHDPRFAWANGKPVKNVEQWILLKEAMPRKKPVDKLAEREAEYKARLEREALLLQKYYEDKENRDINN
jgi:pyruvate/2-oxoacid:ferredoxin oxidoreductase beta subunit